VTHEHADDRSARPNGTPEPGSELQVRASDEERQVVADLLGEHASAGRITLGELEERVGRAYAATTRAELADLTRDLPVATEPAQRQGPHRRWSWPAEPRGPIRRWSVAIMGGSTRRGRMRLSGHVNAIAIMGGDDLDLREAEFDGDELVINVFCLMGGPDIYLPDTVEVELSGVAIMGGNDERGSTRQARPGAPLVRVRSFALMGGTDVWRLPAETRGQSLKQARRAAKKLERDSR
jgi:hypothetical protein